MKTKTTVLEIYSDIHLEFGNLVYKNDPNTDIVVIAGDLGPGLSGVKWLKKNIKDKPVIYVAGNHEFYGQEITSTYKKIKNATEGSNIHFLQNEKVVVNGVSFLGCTLWTDFNLYGNQPLSIAMARSQMNDYNQIFLKDGKSKLKLNPDFILNEHKNSIEFLNKNIEAGDIVVTHHAPHEISTRGGFSGRRTNAFYASNLTNLIEDKKPQLWIHGHCHSENDYMIGETNIVSNARGYVGYEVFSSSFPGLKKEVK